MLDGGGGEPWWCKRQTERAGCGRGPLPDEKRACLVTGSDPADLGVEISIRRGSKSSRRSAGSTFLASRSATSLRTGESSCPFPVWCPPSAPAGKFGPPTWPRKSPLPTRSNGTACRRRKGRGFYPWEDVSKFAVLTKGGKPVGNLFMGCKGRTAHFLSLAGVSFNDSETRGFWAEAGKPKTSPRRNGNGEGPEAAPGNFNASGRWRR